MLMINFSSWSVSLLSASWRVWPLRWGYCCSRLHFSGDSWWYLVADLKNEAGCLMHKKMFVCSMLTRSKILMVDNVLKFLQRIFANDFLDALSFSRLGPGISFSRRSSDWNWKNVGSFLSILLKYTLPHLCVKRIKFVGGLANVTEIVVDYCSIFVAGTTKGWIRLVWVRSFLLFYGIETVLMIGGVSWKFADLAPIGSLKAFERRLDSQMILQSVCILILNYFRLLLAICSVRCFCCGL